MKYAGICLMIAAFANMTDRVRTNSADLGPSGIANWSLVIFSQKPDEMIYHVHICLGEEFKHTLPWEVAQAADNFEVNMLKGDKEYILIKKSDPTTNRGNDEAENYITFDMTTFEWSFTFDEKSKAGKYNFFSDFEMIVWYNIYLRAPPKLVKDSPRVYISKTHEYGLFCGDYEQHQFGWPMATVYWEYNCETLIVDGYRAFMDRGDTDGRYVVDRPKDFKEEEINLYTCYIKQEPNYWYCSADERKDHVGKEYTCTPTEITTGTEIPETTTDGVSGVGSLTDDSNQGLALMVGLGFLLLQLYSSLRSYH